MQARKHIALVAHDSCKKVLLEWAREHLDELKKHDLCSTGTTGIMLREQLGLEVQGYLSGPLGGDLQIGAAISEGRIDLIIFFWDPLNVQPHDSDIRALLRVAALYNTPMACNRATAEFLFTSPLISSSFDNVPSDAIDRYQQSRRMLLNDIGGKKS